MRNSLSPERTAKILGVLVCGVVVLLGLAVPGGTVRAQSDLPMFYSVLGPDGIVARVITDQANCPDITIDGAASAMQLRAAPDADFPVTVCEMTLPESTKSAAVLGHEIKLPKDKPERVVVIGDTGCRLKGSTVQSCNIPAQWPFAQLADSAAQTNPDLIIHVGDYHYRESPCDEAKADCAGSPFGDNWAAWNADLFTPGRVLLEAAPWVIVPGNHEDCARAGIGYFRLLDPRPMPATCPNYTEPYAISYVEPQIIVVDDSTVNDYEIQPDQVEIFKQQFDEVNKLASQGPSWIALHDPMYVFGHLGETDGVEQRFIDQLTLQQATNNQFPATVQAFFSGHIHLFQVLSFDQQRPPQLVVGNSGTLLDPPVTTPLTGLEMAGMPVTYGTMLSKFGFAQMERAGEKWNIAMKDVNGGLMASCVLADKALLCDEALVPATGAAVPDANLWLVVALVGGVVLVVGVGMVRGRMADRR